MVQSFSSGISARSTSSARLCAPGSIVRQVPPAAVQRGKAQLASCVPMKPRAECRALRIARWLGASAPALGESERFLRGGRLAASARPAPASLRRTIRPPQAPPEWFSSSPTAARPRQARQVPLRSIPLRGFIFFAPFGRRASPSALTDSIRSAHVPRSDRIESAAIQAFSESRQAVGEARCSGASSSRILPEKHSVSASSDRMLLLQSRSRPAYAARKVGEPPVGTGHCSLPENHSTSASSDRMVLLQSDSGPASAGSPGSASLNPPSGVLFFAPFGRRAPQQTFSLS